MSDQRARRFKALSIALILSGGLLYLTTYIFVYGPELGDNETQSCDGRLVPPSTPEGPTNAFHTQWPLGSSCVYGNVIVPEPDWIPTYLAIGAGSLAALGLGLGIYGVLRREERTSVG